MTTLALDIGASHCGWARSDWRCGSWSPKDAPGYDGDHGMALAMFHDWLDAMLAQEQVDCLAIERPFGTASFTSRLTMLMEGVAHMVAWSRKVDRTDRTANEVRKGLLGFATLPKQFGESKAARTRELDRLVLAAVRARGFNPPNEHAADACALLVCVECRKPVSRLAVAA